MINQGIGDKELVKAYVKGNNIALEKLIFRHKKKIFTHIYLLVKDKDLAHDLFQDTMLKVIDTLKAGKYTEEGKFLPWAMRIAHNLCIDHFRRNAKMPMIETKDGTDVFSFIDLKDDTHEEKIMKLQTDERLRRIVSELPFEQKEVLIMRLYDDLSFKEIADITNVSINTALGRMRYALINLRKLIEKHGIVL
jgi:RNA polymerase sigma-70 factor (ECF subfamily)